MPGQFRQRVLEVMQHFPSHRLGVGAEQRSERVWACQNFRGVDATVHRASGANGLIRPQAVKPYYQMLKLNEGRKVPM